MIAESQGKEGTSDRETPAQGEFLARRVAEPTEVDRHRHRGPQGSHDDAKEQPEVTHRWAKTCGQAAEPKNGK